LTWVEGAESILTFEENPESVTQYFQNADLILCLDYNAIDRVGPEIAPLLADSTAVKIMIDHHLYPAEFCAITVSEPTVCSAAQLIYELIDQSGNLDLLHVKMATPIYLGIMTDTGSFRFSSVEPRTHEIIAQLLKVGVNQADIHEKVFDTNTIERLQLRGHVVSENLEILPDYPVAILSVSENDLIRFGYKKGDTDGLVNVALSIQGVKIAAFFAEKDGKVKISFRSKGEYFVNSLAMDNFDGGGHKYAAGGISSLSLEETISRFKSLLSTYY
jgi:phosphoesterase RecJ-like protein